MDEPESELAPALELRRLAAELAAERYVNQLAVARLVRLQPAYDELRVVVRGLQNNAFWTVRQTWFALANRLGLSKTGRAPFYDPGPIEGDVALDRYDRWRLENDLRPADRDWMRAAVGAFTHRPRFSVLLPTYDSSEVYLAAALDSVVAQIYPDWELCIADDGSHKPHVRAVLERYATDPRIRVIYRPLNGHISAATNSALELATGDFIGLLDHDDVLSEDALFFAALRINARPDVDMLYSDEDKIDDRGRRSSPFFKPDWSPESFLSRMYTGHFGVYRTALVRQIGGFRESFEGSQDYDLVLRLTERTEAVEHIARVLYHWRLHGGSTTSAMSVKPYAQSAAMRALGEALMRRGTPGAVVPNLDSPGAYTIRYTIERYEKIGLIVAADRCDDELATMLRTVVALTAYPNYELLVVNAGNAAAPSCEAFAELLRSEPRLRVVRCDVAAADSARKNAGAAGAAGAYLVFLHPQVRVTQADWLEALVEQVQRESIGIAGAKIVDRDGRLYHAGIVLGLAGIAGQGHRNAPGDTPGYFNAAGAVSNVSAVSTACLMIHRAAFDGSGGFDPRLGPKYNGVDLCLRVLATGRRIVYVAHVTVTIEAAQSLDVALEAEDDDAQRTLLLSRWPIARGYDRYYNRNLTLLREDYTPAP